MLSPLRHTARMSQPAPLLGTVIEGYRLCETLGDGNMGRVYRAVRVETDPAAQDALGAADEIAFKLLEGPLAQDPKRVALFEREARLAMGLRHPHIVRVYGHGRLTDGVLYLRMELVRGRDLRAVLNDVGGPLSVRRVVTMGQQLAQALTAMHAAGVVHRDLKPANVMLVDAGSDERVKLVDFGIARRLQESDELTGTGPGFGTLRYSAPERFRKIRELTGAVDTYALGILLFEAMTGAHPLQPTDDSADALIHLHLTEPPISLQALWPQAPTDLSTLLMRLLDKDPSRRPTAEQVADRLSALSVRVPDEVLVLQVPAPASARSDATEPPQSPSLGDYLQTASPLAKGRAERVPDVSDGMNRRQWLRRIGSILGVCGLAGVGVFAWRLQHPIQRSPDFDAVPYPDASQRTKPPPGMVYIAGGRFVQGSSEAQIQEQLADCEKVEGDCIESQFRRQQPQRTVLMSPFFLDQTEVTNQAFATWLNSGSRVFDLEEGHTIRLGKRPIASLYGEAAGLIWTGSRYEPKPGMADRPLVNVSWIGATIYCADRGLKLPSEAQFEYVASQHGHAKYPWGDTQPDCTSAVSLGHQVDGGCPGSGLPAVGSSLLDHSPEGVYDLGGSVIEWTLDRFVQSYWPCDACRDPVAPNEAKDPSTDGLDVYRVIRGSSDAASRVQARATFRAKAPENRFLVNVGFRCALPLSPSAKETEK